jgi:hypothetical protein
MQGEGITLSLHNLFFKARNELWIKQKLRKKLLRL